MWKCRNHSGHHPRTWQTYVGWGICSGLVRKKDLSMDEAYGHAADARLWSSAKSATRRFIGNPSRRKQRHRSLESRLEIERLTSGLEGAVEKVSAQVTRWQSYLQYARFCGEEVAISSPYPTT